MSTTDPGPTPAPPSSWPAARAIPAAGSLPLQTDGNVQGNVLAGFNKDHQVLLFISLPSLEVGRAFLTWLLPRVAHNDQVFAFNARFGAARHASGSDPANPVAVWTSVSLTKDGIDLLAPDAISSLAISPPTWV